MTYRIKDKTTKKTFTARNESELYSIAVDLSLLHRSAVYFDETATADDLISDLEGWGAVVTEEDDD